MQEGKLVFIMPEDNRYVDNRFQDQQLQHLHLHGYKRLVCNLRNYRGWVQCIINILRSNEYYLPQYDHQNP